MILCENSELILEACAMVVVVVPRICRPTQGYVDDVRSVDWQHKEPTYISLAHRWVVGQCSRVKPGSRKTGQYQPPPTHPPPLPKNYKTVVFQTCWWEMEWEGGSQALVGFRAKHKMFENYTDYQRMEVFAIL